MIPEIILEDNWKFYKIAGIRKVEYAGPEEEMATEERAFRVLKLKNINLTRRPLPRIGSYLGEDEVDDFINDGWMVTIK